MCSACSLNSRERVGLLLEMKTKYLQIVQHIKSVFLRCCFGLDKNEELTIMNLLSVESTAFGGAVMIIEMWHSIPIYVGQHHELILVINCSYKCFIILLY